MLLFNQNRRRKCGSGRECEGGHWRVPPRCVVPLLDLVHGRGTSSHPRASVRFRFLLGTGKASPGAETREGLSGERSLVPLVLGPSASTTPSHPFAFFSPFFYSRSLLASYPFHPKLPSLAPTPRTHLNPNPARRTPVYKRGCTATDEEFRGHAGIGVWSQRARELCH